MPLLHRVAERILVRWLVARGRADVRTLGGTGTRLNGGVDLTYSWQGSRHRAIVKPDPYFGTDPRLIADRSLSYYRSDAAAYGLEAIADAATREPGWAVRTDADEIHYYFLAIAQPEDEVAALMAGPDEVFFGELQVGRDDLAVIPTASLATWFESNSGRYPSRPVITGATSAWYRMVPREDVDRAVAGVRHEGSIFSGLRG